MNSLLRQKKNLQLVQVLRGVASLLVVLYHTTVNFNDKAGVPFFFNSFSFGASGVDIFFVLSGFIITYTSYQSLGQPGRLGTFIKRRLVRIVPVYWIIITAFLILRILLPAFYRTGFSITFANLLPTYLLFPEHEMINGVSWTLTFELFFYLLFAFAFLIPSKKWIFFFSVIYSLLLIGLAVSGYDLKQGDAWTRLFVSPLNVEFFMGVLSVLAIPYISRRTAVTFVVSGILIFIVSGVITNHGIVLFTNEYNRVVLFGIPSFLILSGIVKLEIDKNYRIHTILLTLGEASYSLYLLHLPLIAAGLAVLKKFTITNTFLLHVITVVFIALICYFSILFYKFIEKPLTGKLNRISAGSRSDR